MRNALEQHGYNADTTPIDTLMAAPPHVGLAVAADMDTENFGHSDYDPDADC